MTRISLVIPCFNEEDAIPVFLSRVVPIMDATGLDFEMVASPIRTAHAIASS